MFDFPGMPVPLSHKDDPNGLLEAGKQCALVLAGLENRPYQFTVDIRPLDEVPRKVAAVPLGDDEVAMLGAAHRLHVNLYDMFGQQVLATNASEVLPPDLDGREVVWNEPDALMVLAYSFLESTADVRSSWMEHCCDLLGIDAEAAMEAFEVAGMEDARVDAFLQAVVLWEVVDSQKNIGSNIDVPEGFVEFFGRIAEFGKHELTEFVNEYLARANEIKSLNNLWENS